MKPVLKYTTLGAGHWINDCIAGYIIGSLFYQGHSAMEIGVYTLLYNIIAFGGQLVFAKIIEQYFLPKKYLVTTFILLIGSLLFLPTLPQLAILFSGAASAIFHVTGGLEATRADDKSFGIGIFASPGILGLITGGFLSYMHVDFAWTGILLSVAYILVISLFYKTEGIFFQSRQEEPAIEGHDIIMCVLVTAISLRSVIWDVMQMIQQDNYAWLTIVAVAAMCGKIAGGFLADKIGYKRYTLYALALSIPFLALFKKNIIALSIGVFLLQSTIPSTTVMLLRVVKRKPALAIALSFGLSIFIAISLFYTPLVKYLDNNLVIFITLSIAIVLLAIYGWLPLKMRKKRSPEAQDSIK